MAKRPKKAKSRRGSPPRNEGVSWKVVTIRPVPFGGFYYDDETLMARKVHVSIVSNQLTEPVEDTLDVEPGGHAEWTPPVVDVIGVWFSAVNAAGIEVAPPATCQHWPTLGGFVTRTRARTFLRFGSFNAESELLCDTMEPLQLPRGIAAHPGVAPERVPFGRFYYDDETGAASEVDMIVITESGEDKTRRRTVEEGHAEYFDDGEPPLSDVVEVRFQPLAAGDALGRESRPETGRHITEAGGRTTGPVVRNRIVYVRKS
jgi:hypothetical protein